MNILMIILGVVALLLVITNGIMVKGSLINNDLLFFFLVSYILVISSAIFKWWFSDSLLANISIVSLLINESFLAFELRKTKYMNWIFLIFGLTFYLALWFFLV